LYEISGHWSHYRDGMYPPMDVGGEQVVLRPSLCPHHALIYRSRGHSYRDLPLRMAELGGMYRSELSGALGGLTRVRAMQLNDAHIFCTPDQVAAEAAAALGLIKAAYRALGIEPTRYRLSLPGQDAKYVGGRDMWDRAAGFLEQVLVEAGVPYEAEEGEAAFYGPKIDVQVADSAEREASLSTIQVDFYLPERFGLEYAGADGARHRPVMVHRSIIGSAERAVAHLIDVHGGAFPSWLAPVQLVVLPVADAQLPEAEELAAQAVRAGLRAVVARPESGSLGARIRAHRLVPYQAVIGAREAVAGQAALRLRDGRQVPAQPVGEVLAGIGERVAAHSTELWEEAAISV
jgi:threonyl-tRNA synthetase